MINCNNLSKTYKGNSQPALNNLSLDIPEHAVFGFLGPNGAGKTTTINMLTGLMRPTSGTATIAGVDVRFNSTKLRKQIGYLGQVPAMYNWMTASELLIFVARLFGLSKSEAMKRTSLLLEMSGLSQTHKKRIKAFSGGMLQRLGIAQALISKPKVLFLDEPTSALDPIGRKEVLEFITNLSIETTIFMSTHILNDVERICSHVGILNKGDLITFDKLDNLKHIYSSNLCEIETENPNDLSSIQSKLKEFNLSGTIKSNLVSVRLGNTNEDFKTILNTIQSLGICANRIEIKKPSLEEIFVDIINK